MEAQRRRAMTRIPIIQFVIHLDDAVSVETDNPVRNPPGKVSKIHCIRQITKIPNTINNPVDNLDF